METITLATLAQASAQDVFNQAAKHLLTQNAKSFTSSISCAYRGNYGLQCAAGCFISDEEYDADFERKNWRHLVNDDLVPEAHSSLILALQKVHDNSNAEDWKDKLDEVAMKFNLEKFSL